MEAVDDISDKPNICSRFATWLSVRYQYFLDLLTPHTSVRWLMCFLLIMGYMSRILYVQGYYLITYALGIYHLNLFIAFLTPKIDPAWYFDSEDEDDEEGGTLPKSANEEFRPFMRRLPEFKFWLSVMKSTLVAFAMTFFEFFDIPVFWPVLVMYFIMIFCLTMKRQIRHMMRYRYLPFTSGKPKHTGKEDSGPVVQAL